MRRITPSASPGALRATIALTASLMLAACGSSATTTTATTTKVSPTTLNASGANGATTSAASSPATTNAPGKLAACDLVTKAEAEAVVGVPVDPGVQSTNASSCEYFPVDPVSAGATTGVTIQIADAAAFAKAKGSGPVLKAKVTPIAGLGDDAFSIVIPTASGTTFSQQLEVLKGARSVVITVGKKGASDDDIASLEKSLATKIVPRLP
jgi:hypothetical protein